MVIDATPLEAAVVIGPSARMRAVHAFIRVIGPSDSTVLITGETGTGKEVAAQLLHQASPRHARPFVPVSCALLSPTVIESELFGHERGAFTDAITERRGRFEQADGGTIFLDDVDDVPPAMQVKLLRVLQNRTFERVGGSRVMPIDVRVIAATKRSLPQLVSEGRFREDLYHRLNVLPLMLPPLRERADDVPALMDHFLRRYARRDGQPPVVPAAMRDAFLRYAWPGNVRELENACRRIAQTCTCGTLRVGCLLPEMVFGRRGEARPAAGTTPAPASGPISLDDRLREVETQLIRWALRVSEGNRSKAAALLQMRRSTLADRIERCGL